MRALRFPHTATLFPPPFSRRIGMLQNIMNLRDSVFVNTLGFLWQLGLFYPGAFPMKIRCFWKWKIICEARAPPPPPKEKEGVPWPSPGPRSLEGTPASEDLCFVRRASFAERKFPAWPRARMASAPLAPPSPPCRRASGGREAALARPSPSAPALRSPLTARSPISVRSPLGIRLRRSAGRLRCSGPALWKPWRRLPFLPCGRRCALPGCQELSHSGAFAGTSSSLKAVTLFS